MQQVSRAKSYMQQLDEWINAHVILPLHEAYQEGERLRSDEPFDRTADVVKKAIREKVLESYHNGQAAGLRKER